MSEVMEMHTEKELHPRVKKLKTLFMTLPQRDTPGTDAPYGPMAVMTYLKKHGFHDMDLYNVDLLRPPRAEVLDYIEKYNPDILAISAPVSTSYENCKYYSLEIKKRLPRIKIILGGNMAASAEILLKKTGVDICVLGEGELPALELFNRLEEGKWLSDFKDIKGLGFLDEKGAFINTGHAEQLPKEEVFDVKWELLTRENIDHCLIPVDGVKKGTGLYKHISGLNAEMSEKIKGKRIGVMALSKGCVARCTFCHRFQKGIRFVPVDICIQRIKELRDKYNVGVFRFGDECFGADRRWLDEFLTKVKELDIVFAVAGMRVQFVTPELMARMKDAGCTAIIYGMETGSERMIEIMEKRASIEDNLRAFKATVDAGLYTIPQLIIGMPGENHETIRETAEFIAQNLIRSPYLVPREMSINYAQALPGTPLYEYARYKGLIGKSLDEEEGYLLYISDRNASDEETTLNFTDYSRLTLCSWIGVIEAIVYFRYCEHFGKEHYFQVMFGSSKPPSIWRSLAQRKFMRAFESSPVLMYRLIPVMPWIKLVQILFKFGPKLAFKMFGEHVWFAIKSVACKPKPIASKSLRRIVEKDLENVFEGSDSMIPLRKGR